MHFGPPKYVFVAASRKMIVFNKLRPKFRSERVGQKVVTQIFYTKKTKTPRRIVCRKIVYIRKSSHYLYNVVNTGVKQLYMYIIIQGLSMASQTIERKLHIVLYEQCSKVSLRSRMKDFNAHITAIHWTDTLLKVALGRKIYDHKICKTQTNFRNYFEYGSNKNIRVLLSILGS